MPWVVRLTAASDDSEDLAPHRLPPPPGGGARGVGVCVVTFTINWLSVLNAIAGAYSENPSVVCIVGGHNSDDYGTNRILLHHAILSVHRRPQIRTGLSRITLYFQAIAGDLWRHKDYSDGLCSSSPISKLLFLPCNTRWRSILLYLHPCHAPPIVKEELRCIGSCSIIGVYSGLHRILSVVQSCRLVDDSRTSAPLVSAGHAHGTQEKVKPFSHHQRKKTHLAIAVTGFASFQIPIEVRKQDLLALKE
ncbi:Pyruvate decarboxylase [Musa troglodytarum]|uniref:pyruvate decarboxylase n=1 Tax=Musa troglodytarum TaxID=320322 RepID=A0A9E7FQQ6_9LILI|nr:Pyruvate decarboxylase [Musa troglodytarum]